MLHKKLSDIEDTILDMIQTVDYSAISPKLNNITFLKGRREKGAKIKPPLIAVYLDSANITHAGMSNHEEWQVPVVIIGLVIDKNANDGRELSTEMVMKARDELIKDRSIRGKVRDVVGTGFTMGDERGEVGRNAFGAGAELELRFRYRPELN
jgi:hypothetical protein